MSRINTNPSSLIAQRNLMANNRTLNSTLERLSTGLRINRGKDDPAGLIASENLRAEKVALSAAISNSERADQMVNIAEGGLAEVNNLLTELRGLVTATANNAGLSVDEKNANQLQVDSILQTIDRISDATNFQGSKLLNGNLDFTTTNVAAGVSDYRINAAKIATGGTLAVKAQVTASAQRGTLFLSTAAATISTGGAAALFTIEVAGATGSREFSFASGATLTDVAAAITSFKDALGVSAVASGNYVKIKSTDFGSDNFVSVKVINATTLTGGIVSGAATNENTVGAGGSIFASTAAANGIRDLGQDIGATVNGLLATGKGKALRVNSDGLDTEFTLTNAVAQTLGAVNAFTITGGGATFQLASKVDITGKVALGIQNVASRKLGNSTLGFLNSLASGKANNVSSGNLTSASKIVEEAIRSISGLRGRLGAFQKNVISSTINNLNVSLENSSAAESVIRDADFAAETASLTRGQILAQAAGNSLGLANAQPQQALSLLRG